MKVKKYAIPAGGASDKTNGTSHTELTSDVVALAHSRNIDSTMMEDFAPS